MNKTFKTLIALALSFSCLAIAGCTSEKLRAEENPLVSRESHTVDFFNNYLREEFTLSNGTKGKGNNLIYKTIEVLDGSLIEKPEDPTRKNYEFVGWFKEESCVNEWNFATDAVTSNVRLFAKWGVSQKEETPEPEYTPPSTVLEESADTNCVINSVMNFKINDGQVKLSTAAIARLQAHADDVLPLLEYKVKANKNIRATYSSNHISVTCSDELGSDNISILVKDNSSALTLDNSTYETKAKNYEKKIDEENENYHVMLAGSSSIEFWTSSKEDLAPVVSYNHGIGGTTIEEWDNSLNQRLVFPYKPKMVVYYVGINNVINSKQSASVIWANLQKFLDNTHAQLPDTKVQYIMMNLIPGYKTYWDVINEVNNNLVAYQKNNTWLTLINPGLALLKANGEPNAAYFRTDGLHLSYYGYVVWGEIIKQSIYAGLEEQ